MSKYDFKSKVERPESIKWANMYKTCPKAKEDVVPLSTADMEFMTAPEIAKGLQEYLDHAVLGYSQPTEEYWQAVANWMRERHDFQVDPSWITVVSGVVPALYQAVKSFSAPGDGVVVMPPVYFPFYSAIEKSGRRIVNCPLQLQGDKYVMDLELLSELTAGTDNKLVLFCSPHNPVGRVWELEELEALAEIAIRNELIIVSDEIHHDIIMPGYKHIVFQTLSEELAQRVITCTAPTKTFNIAGLAVSNIIIKNPELREKFSATLTNCGFHGSTILGYKACELAYAKCGDWLDELIQVFVENEKLTRSFFAERCPKVKIAPLEGTYLLWLDFNCLGMNEKELSEFMIKEANFITNDGYIFGEEGKGFIRINLALPAETLKIQLERLYQAMINKGLA